MIYFWMIWGHPNSRKPLGVASSWWGYPLDGLFHGKSQFKMDDDWGTSISGNPYVDYILHLKGGICWRNMRKTPKTAVLRHSPYPGLQASKQGRKHQSAYTYVYIYICIYIYVYIYIYMYPCICICIGIYIYYVFAYIYICIHNTYL